MVTPLEKPPRPLPFEGRGALRVVAALAFVLAFVVSLACAGLLLAGSVRAQEASGSEATTEVVAAGDPTLQGDVPPEQSLSTSEEAPSPTEQVSLSGEQVPAASEPPPSSSEGVIVATEQERSPATEDPPPAEQAPGPVEETAPGEQAPEAVEGPPPGEPAQPVVEETPPVVAESPPPAEQPPPVVEEGTPPAAEQTPPPAEQTPPPAEQMPPPAEQTPPPAEQTPPPTEQTPPSPGSGQEATTETPAGGTGGEANPERRTTEETEDSQTPNGASASEHKEPANEGALVSSTTATGSSTSAEMPGESTLSDQEGQASSGAPSISTREIRHASHTPDAFEASMIAAGSVGRWLGALGASSDAATALAAIGASPVAIETAVLARSRGSAIESHNSSLAPAPTPSPGPAPGGAGGGSAAAGGSGASSSASFMLVSILLHEAPNVMLRLHVSQPSWHTSFCALILERPD